MSILLRAPAADPVLFPPLRVLRNYYFTVPLRKA